MMIGGRMDWTYRWMHANGFMNAHARTSPLFATPQTTSRRPPTSKPSRCHHHQQCVCVFLSQTHHWGARPEMVTPH